MATRILNNLDQLINVDYAAKIENYAVAKQPPKITKQSPAAGTPVIQGMTIEVHAVSLSDVPYRVIDLAVEPVLNVPLAEIQRVIEDDPRILNAVKTGVIPEQDRSYITQTLNKNLAGRGLAGELSFTDTSQLLNQIGQSGILGF